VYAWRMNKNIIKLLRDAAKEIAEKYDLAFLAVFGSQATGKTHPQSDIDIAFSRDVPTSLKEEVALAFDLSQIVKREDIDLVNLSAAPPLLLHCVSREGVVLFEREPGLFAEFQMYAFKRYIEAKPLFRLQRESLKKFTQRV